MAAPAQDSGGPPGDDALSKWRRKVRARLLSWAPLSVWKALLGLAILLTAGVLRKVGIIHEPGFALLASIGFGLWGYQTTMAQVNGAKRNAAEKREREAGEARREEKPRE